MMATLSQVNAKLNQLASAATSARSEFERQQSLLSSPNKVVTIGDQHIQPVVNLINEIKDHVPGLQALGDLLQATYNVMADWATKHQDYVDANDPTRIPSTLSAPPDSGSPYGSAANVGPTGKVASGLEPVSNQQPMGQAPVSAPDGDRPTDVGNSGTDRTE